MIAQQLPQDLIQRFAESDFKDITEMVMSSREYFKQVMDTTGSFRPVMRYFRGDVHVFDVALRAPMSDDDIVNCYTEAASFVGPVGADRVMYMYDANIEMDGEQKDVMMVMNIGREDESHCAAIAGYVMDDDELRWVDHVVDLDKTSIGKVIDTRTYLTLTSAMIEANRHYPSDIIVMVNTLTRRGHLVTPYT